MKACIVYDSYFGNTEQVAKTVAAELGAQVELCRAAEVKPGQLAGVDLLVVGSPTRAFRPSDAMKAFLKNLPQGALNGMRVAAFDTRIDAEATKSSFLKFMVSIFGYAAKPIANALKARGGQLALPPEGFIVLDSKGPLKDGELERAAKWARELNPA